MAAYRDSFKKTWKDAEFLKHSQKVSKELAPMSYEDVQSLVSTLADTKPETLDYLGGIFAKQGLKAGKK